MVELWFLEGLLFVVEDFLVCIVFLSPEAATSFAPGPRVRLRAIPRGLDGLNS